MLRTENLRFSSRRRRPLFPYEPLFFPYSPIHGRPVARRRQFKCHLLLLRRSVKFRTSPSRSQETPSVAFVKLPHKYRFPKLGLLPLITASYRSDPPRSRLFGIFPICVNGIINTADYSELITDIYGGEKRPLMAGLKLSRKRLS